MLMSADKLPADYVINALSDEAIARGTTYGKLVAALKPGEREAIAERYRTRYRRQRNKTRFRSLTPKGG